MVSTNHFRGRRLAHGLSAPVSPRHPVVAAAAAPPLPPSTGNYWSMVGDAGLGVSTIPLHQADPVLHAADVWWETGFDQEGGSYVLQISYDSLNQELTFVVNVDQGFGGLQFAVWQNVPWDGVTPVTLGPQAWFDGGGNPTGDITAFLPY